MTHNVHATSQLPSVDEKRQLPPVNLAQYHSPAVQFLSAEALAVFCPAPNTQMSQNPGLELAATARNRFAGDLHHEPTNEHEFNRPAKPHCDEINRIAALRQRVRQWPAMCVRTWC